MPGFPLLIWELINYVASVIGFFFLLKWSWWYGIHPAYENIKFNLAVRRILKEEKQREHQEG